MEFPWHDSAWRRLRHEALPQSLLLTAAAGTGEDQFARRLAQGQLCATPAEDWSPCGVCPECHLFEAGTHPDVRVMEPGGTESPTGGGTGEEPERMTKEPTKRTRPVIPVDAIRGIGDFLRLTAHRGKRRVVLVLSAHTMNAAAANALLKLLEEPPAGAHFVLLTTQPARLPATVRSRCVRHHLPQPTRQEAVAWLGANGVRNAELALAQAGGAPVGALALDERFWALRRLVMRMLVDGSTDWVEAAASVSDLDVPQLVHLVQTCCWDLAAARFGGDVRYQLDERDRLASVAGRVDLRKLLAMERTLRSARSLAEHPLNPRLFAEDLLRRYSDLTRAT